MEITRVFCSLAVITVNILLLTFSGVDQVPAGIEILKCRICLQIFLLLTDLNLVIQILGGDSKLHIMSKYVTSS